MIKGIKKGAFAFVPILVLAWLATRWPDLELWILFGALMGLLLQQRSDFGKKGGAT
jgi:hypothetical protein